MTGKNYIGQLYVACQQFAIVGVVVVLWSIPANTLRGDNLESNSPFIPDNFNARQQSNRPATTQPSSSVSDIEFRGVYSLGGKFQFSIYSKKSQRGEWVGLGDSGSSYQVTDFDEATNSIELTIDGKAENLFLRSPDNKPLPVQTASATPKITSAKQAAANRAAKAGNRRPVVRRRVIVPNRTASPSSQNPSQTPQSRRVPTARTPQNTKTQQDAEELLRELQKRKNPS